MPLWQDLVSFRCFGALRQYLVLCPCLVECTLSLVVNVSSNSIS